MRIQARAARWTGCAAGAAALALIMGHAAAMPANAQDAWAPERTVELIVPGTPGSAPDTRARAIQQIWQRHGLVEVPTTVANRPGGGHSIAANYLLSQPEGDAHHLKLTVGTLLSSGVLGNHDVDYTEATPVAFIGNEYYVWVVKADSDIESGEDLFDRLRENPDSLTVGASNPGGLGHIQILNVLKDAGVDIGSVQVVTFAGGGETRAALLGGHIDTTATSASNMAELQRSGDIRTIAVNAPERLGEPYEDVPTLGEFGIESAYLSGWTAILGPKEMTDAQIAYWEDVFQRMMETDEWKEDAELALRDLQFMGSEETREFLRQEHETLVEVIGATLGSQ